MRKRKGGILLFTAILLTIVSLVCLTLSVSYSFIIGISSKKNVITITSGESSMSSSEEEITDLTITKMTDTNGLNQSSYHTFTISKNNVYSIFYKILIGYKDTYITYKPLEYVKVALYTVDGSDNLSSSPIIGPVRVADLYPTKKGKNTPNGRMRIRTGVSTDSGSRGIIG